MVNDIMRAPFIIWFYRLCLLSLLVFETWLIRLNREHYPGYTWLEIVIPLSIIVGISTSFYRRKWSRFYIAAILFVLPLWISICFDITWQEYRDFPLLPALALEMIPPLSIVLLLLFSGATKNYFDSRLSPLDKK